MLALLLAVQLGAQQPTSQPPSPTEPEPRQPEQDQPFNESTATEVDEEVRGPDSLTPQPPSISISQNIQDEPNRHNEQPPFDWPMILITGVIAVFTGLLWWVTKRQASIMDTQTAFIQAQKRIGDRQLELAGDASKAARESIILTHRPRIVVRNVVVNGLRQVKAKADLVELLKGTREEWEAGDVNQFSGYYHIANIGSSTATVREREEHLIIESALPMVRPYDSGTRAECEPIRLEPGESRKIDLPVRPLQGDEGPSIVHGDATLFVVGWLLYYDELGHPRQTGFARQIDWESGRFRGVEDPDYEYSD